MNEVEARILPTPNLMGSATIKPLNGVTDLSKIPQKFHTPAALGCWAVCIFGNPQRMPFDSVVEFMGNLFHGCRSKGMTVIDRDWRKVLVAQTQRGLSVEETLKAANAAAVEAAERRLPNAQMIFCIFERDGVSQKALCSFLFINCDTLFLFFSSSRVSMMKSSFLQRQSLA
jgi:hypothetical protein